MKTVPAWLVALALFVLLVIGVFAYTTCGGPKPPLARKAKRAAQARIEANTRTVATDTTKAAQAAAAGRTHYAAGQVATHQAIQAHVQSRKPLRPGADSTTERLQRILSTY